jgi:hypothetical protein
MCSDVLNQVSSRVFPQKALLAFVQGLGWLKNVRKISSFSFDRVSMACYGITVARAGIVGRVD